ncbi:hypothetical protein IG631_00799 [Alternaria alternata]|nr:hypothetical protein IG631_00799 [Alternaria alternata]
MKSGQNLLDLGLRDICTLIGSYGMEKIQTVPLEANRSSGAVPYLVVFDGFPASFSPCRGCLQAARQGDDDTVPPPLSNTYSCLSAV